jgi:hypothetical protein
MHLSTARSLALAAEEESKILNYSTEYKSDKGSLSSASDLSLSLESGVANVNCAIFASLSVAVDLMF